MLRPIISWLPMTITSPREGIEFSKPVGRGGAATVTLGSGFINRVLPAAAHHIVGLNDDWVVTYLSEWCEAVKRYGAKACVELVPIASYFRHS